MKIFKSTNIASGLVTNQWDDSQGLDASYYEPCFGLPIRQVPIFNEDGSEQRDVDGNLILQTLPAEYTISTEDLGDAPRWAQIRSKRDALLTSCDWTQLSDSPLEPEKKVLWATYRQSLRDLPNTQADVNNIIYPTKPS